VGDYTLTDVKAWWGGAASSIGVLVAVAYPGDALRAAVLFAGMMVAVDCVTGVFASWWGGEQITSRKLVRSAFKVTVYLTLPAIVFWAFTHIGLTGVSSQSATTLASFLIGVELYSVLENLRKAGLVDAPWLIKILDGRFKGQNDDDKDKNHV
jgi:TRAP-type C4-dicarboxylate transport system permease large subunit